MPDESPRPKVTKVAVPDKKGIRPPDTQRGYTAPPPPKKDKTKK